MGAKVWGGKKERREGWAEGRVGGEGLGGLGMRTSAGRSGPKYTLF